MTTAVRSRKRSQPTKPGAEQVHVPPKGTGKYVMEQLPLQPWPSEKAHFCPSLLKPYQNTHLVTLVVISEKLGHPIDFREDFNKCFCLI